MRTKAVLIVVMMGLLTLWPCPASACNCVPPASAAEALAQADSVFVGRVVSIVPIARNPLLPRRGEDPVAVAVAVEMVWKGEARHTIVLQTVINAVSCDGYMFTVDGEYVVFAYREIDGSLAVKLCGGTSRRGDAAAYLAELGGGQLPVDAAVVAAVPTAPIATEPIATLAASGASQEPVVTPTPGVIPAATVVAEPAATPWPLVRMVLGVVGIGGVIAVVSSRRRRRV